MGWGEEHRPQNDGAGTTGEIEEAHRVLDEMGVRPGSLGRRVVDLADAINS